MPTWSEDLKKNTNKTLVRHEISFFRTLTDFYLAKENCGDIHVDNYIQTAKWFVDVFNTINKKFDSQFTKMVINFDARESGKRKDFDGKTTFTIDDILANKAKLSDLARTAETAFSTPYLANKLEQENPNLFKDFYDKLNDQDLNLDTNAFSQYKNLSDAINNNTNFKGTDFAAVAAEVKLKLFVDVEDDLTPMKYKESIKTIAKIQENFNQRGFLSKVFAHIGFGKGADELNAIADFKKTLVAKSEMPIKNINDDINDVLADEDYDFFDSEFINNEEEAFFDCAKNTIKNNPLPQQNEFTKKLGEMVNDAPKQEMSKQKEVLPDNVRVIDGHYDIVNEQNP